VKKIFILSILFILIFPLASAETVTKIYNASSTTTINSGWTNPTYVYSSDNLRAYTSTNNAEQEYSGYGFDIPSNAQNIQVYVGIEGYTTDTSETLYVKVRVPYTTYTRTATDYTTETLQWINFTSSRTWTPSDVNEIVTRIAYSNVIGGGCYPNNTFFIIANQTNGSLFQTTWKFLPVDKIKEGNLALSWNSTSKRIQLTPVSAVSVHEGNWTLYDIWSGVLNISFNLFGENYIIEWKSHSEFNGEHPLYVYRNSTGRWERLSVSTIYKLWKEGEDLYLNHLWWNYTLKPFKITKITLRNFTGKVYALRSYPEIMFFGKTLTPQEYKFLTFLKNLGLPIGKYPPFLIISVKTPYTYYVDWLPVKIIYEIPAEDTTPPTYSQISDNSSGQVYQGTPVEVRTFWSDDTQLSTAIVRTNVTGTWENYTYCSFTTDTGWCNKTIDTSNTLGTVCWNEWANDTSGNWNKSMPINCFEVIKKKKKVGIDDPLYCNIPHYSPYKDIYISCRPINNNTGQPIETTVTCSAWDSDFINRIQGPSAAENKGGGLYVWKLSRGNIVYGNCYYINCSTNINNVFNNYGSTICIEGVEKEKIMFMGTEYVAGTNGTMFLQLLTTDGFPIDNASCRITIYYPNKTKFIDNEQMVFLEDGIYYYDFVVPNTYGVYIARANCLYKYIISDKEFVDSSYIVSGTESGDYKNTYTSDDLKHEITENTSATPNLDLYYNFTDLDIAGLNITKIDIELEYAWDKLSGLDTENVTIFFYNFENNSWEQIYNLTRSDTDTLWFYTINDASRFINNDAISVRFRNDIDTSSSYMLRIDLFDLAIHSEGNVYESLRGSSEINVVPIEKSVWSYGTRNLTYYPDINISSTSLNEIAYTVWNYSTRTLTSFGTLIADIWSYSIRTLTDYYFNTTAQYVWNYPDRTIQNATFTNVTFSLGEDALRSIAREVILYICGVTDIC